MHTSGPQVVYPEYPSVDAVVPGADCFPEEELLHQRR